MRIDVRVQYLIVRCAIVLTIVVGVGTATFFAAGCGGEIAPGTASDRNAGNGADDAGNARSRNDAGVTKDGCPEGLPGPALVALVEDGGAPYCIDATEVTNAQYASFIAAGVSPISEELPCSQNSSFLPLFGWPAASSDANRPVVNVDWCDARAFCAWAGKKLCGAPGKTSGSPHDAKNPDTSLWFSACSNLGARQFPYGNDYGPTTCNGADDNVIATLDVDLPVTCTDFNAPIFDMSGNVWEWEDACESDDPLARCRLRGGSFRSNADSLACAAADLAARNSAFDDFGFRCCAE